MITITIGHSSRTIKEFSPSWLREQIDARRAAGANAVVRVDIKTACANLTLATPGDPGSGGGGRPPNHQEREIFDLWNKRGLNRADFIIGQLVAFLSQIKSWC